MNPTEHSAINTTQPLPVLLTGGYTCRNRGDWALAESALQSVRRAGLPARILTQVFKPTGEPPIDEPLDVIAITDESGPRRQKLMSLGLKPLYYAAQARDMRRHLREAKRRLHDAGAVGDPLLWYVGGGYMNDVIAHGPYSTRLGLVALDEGYRVILTGQTIGPYRTPRFQSQIEEFLRRVDFLSVRDPESLERVNAIQGLRCEPQLRLDDAFYLDTLTMSTDELRRAVLEQQGVTLPERWVFFTAHRQGGTDTPPAFDAMAQVAREAITKGYGAVFVSMFGHPTPEDEPLLRIVQELGENAHYVDWRATVPMIRALTRDASLIVSTRLHALIFGLHAGTPGMCLYSGEYYRAKAFRTVERWGMSELALDVSKDAESIVPIAIDALERESELREVIAQRRPPETGKPNPAIAFLEQLAQRHPA